VLRVAEKAGCGVELNANPYRLDVDWRILPKLAAQKIPVGIFPDAHSVSGLADVKYGVAMARKAGLARRHVINTLPRKEMEAWLREQKL
jgi:DNA polymerase (family X)